MNAPAFRETLVPPLGHRLNVGGPGPWTEHAGCLVVGSQGTLHSTGHDSTYTLMPENKFADFKKPEPTLPRHGSHERERLAACRGGPKAMSNFDYGAVLTEFVLLGNVATQFARSIQYDPITMACIGDAEATAALKREHCAGVGDLARQLPEGRGDCCEPNIKLSMAMVRHGRRLTRRHPAPWPDFR